MGFVGKFAAKKSEYPIGQKPRGGKTLAAVGACVESDCVWGSEKNPMAIRFSFAGIMTKGRVKFMAGQDITYDLENQACDEASSFHRLDDEDRAAVIALIDRAVSFIAESENPRLAAWQVAFGIGTGICIGSSMHKKAAELGCSVTCISGGARKFCRQAGLPPSAYMRETPNQKR